MRIYCGGALRQTLTRSMSTVKDMWVVGEVDFATNGSCTFSPDGTTVQVP